MKIFSRIQLLKFLLVIVGLLGMMNAGWSQYEKIGYGFRAGPSYSKITGPSETGPNGEELEEFNNSNGFHIGAAVSYKFTDLVGMRAELLFSQRGTKYVYDGPSYYVLGRYSTRTTTINGHRHQELRVNNAFLDIPIVAYYKLGILELAGGFNTGFLLASTAGGTTTFDGLSPQGAAVPFSVSLDHNYKADDAKSASEELQALTVDGIPYGVPETTHAYYEFETRDKNLYKTFDFGLVAGASVFINEGLFISFRYIHGLGDVDQNEYDTSLQSLSNGNVIPRADENKSKSIQLSIGFSF